jgi:PAS domain S-box-containing protein
MASLAPSTPATSPSDAEKRFRGAFDFAPIGMAIVAPTGEWLDVNPALARMLGYEPRDFLGRTRQELTHPDDVA